MANKHPLPAGKGKSGQISTKVVKPGEAKRGAGDHKHVPDNKTWQNVMHVPHKD